MLSFFKESEIYTLLLHSDHCKDQRIKVKQLDHLVYAGLPAPSTKEDNYLLLKKKTPKDDKKKSAKRSKVRNRETSEINLHHQLASPLIFKH